MTAGLVLGMALVATGLALLCHLSYTNLTSNKNKEGEHDDAEDPAIGGNPTRTGPDNDCFVSFCFFRVAQVKNHETWIVACLMTGATVLVLSMV